MNFSNTRRILTVLVVVTFITRIVLAFRPEVKLTERPYQEDAFYMFSCAYQFAQGNGYSVDGVHPTNGVQPLIVLLYAPFFAAFSDKWDGLRATFGLVALLEALCVIMVFKLVRAMARKRNDEADRAGLIGSAIWTFSYTLLVHNANGLETGLLALGYLVVLWYYTVLTDPEEPPTYLNWVLLGVLLGLLVLARIDAAIFVVLWFLFDIWKFRRPSRTVIAAAIAVIVSSPWWIYNVTTFGSLMPISGQSEALESLLHINLFTTPQVIGDILAVVFYTPYIGLTPSLAVGWGIAMISIWVLLNQKLRLLESLRLSYRLEILIPLVLTSAVLIIYYTFFFSAPHFISRYLHPMRIMALLLLSISLPIVWGRFKDRKLFRIVTAVVLLAAATFSVILYQRAFTTKKSSPAYFTGLWARGVAPEKVGMTSSGTANFVSDNVVNLDGKVNPDALKARKAGTLGEYVVDADIKYVADWKETADMIASQAARRGVTYRKVHSIGPILVLERKD